MLLTLLFCFNTASAEPVEITEIDMLFENIGQQVIVNNSIINDPHLELALGNLDTMFDFACPVPETEGPIAKEGLKVAIANKQLRGYLCFNGITKLPIYKKYDIKYIRDSGTTRTGHTLTHYSERPNVSFYIQDKISMYECYDLEYIMKIQNGKILLRTSDQKDFVRYQNKEYQKIRAEIYAGYASNSFWQKILAKDSINKVEDWMLDSLPEFDVSLCYACHLGNIELVRKLIGQDAKIENCTITFDYGSIPFSILLASQNGNSDTLLFLLEKTPQAAIRYHKKEVGRHRVSFSPVISAAANGHLECLKVLANNSFDLNIENEFGNTALHRAVKHNHIDIVKYLLEQKVDADRKNNNGETPLELGKNNDSDKTIIDIFREQLQYTELSDQEITIRSNNL